MTYDFLTRFLACYLGIMTLIVSSLLVFNIHLYEASRPHDRRAGGRSASLTYSKSEIEALDQAGRGNGRSTVAAAGGTETKIFGQKLARAGEINIKSIILR